MMKVYIIQDHDGRILSVNRTPDGVAHFVVSHGPNASIGGKEVEIESIDRALSNNGTISVDFSDGTPSLRVEYHAVLV